MKKIINKLNVLLALIALSTFGCKSDILNGPIENSSEKPGIVTNVTVENKSGSALLTYTLPANEGLSYVKAEYEIRPGVKREVVSSYYSNQLLVDGFNSTNETEVKLYAVTKSEVKSDPIMVKIKPLKSAIQNTYESLKIVAGFGGPNIKFSNIDKASIIIVPFIKTSTGTIKSLDKIYSQTAVGNFTIRGQEPELTKFGFVIADRFGNHTDTAYRDLTPYSEIKLDKTKFALYSLPGDAKPAYPEALLRYLWDNSYPTTATWPRAFTTEGATTPQTITIDLGVTTALSRFVFFPRTESGNRFYVRPNLREYEIWATNTPNVDGSYDSWTKIATGTVLKPSGLPAGTETAEDLAYALSGWGIDFEPGLPSYRYFRIRSLRNWENTFSIMAAQIDIYGSK